MEERVRKAYEVAKELADACNRDAEWYAVFGSVFHAMLLVAPVAELKANSKAA